MSEFNNKIPVTAIIPVGNEAHNLKEAIKSVSFANEIIVVDSFSTDGTYAIAKEFADIVLQRVFNYPAAQKNWAIPQASNSWVFLLDADERVTPELEQEIKTIVLGTTNNTKFWAYRKNYFMDTHMKHGGLETDKVIRLFRKECVYQDKHVHEEIVRDGREGFFKNKLYHNTYVDFDTYLNKKNRYACWSAKDHMDKTGRITAFHVVVKPMWRFVKHYLVQRGFLDGFPGFVYASVESFSVFNRYVKLWVIRKK